MPDFGTPPSPQDLQFRHAEPIVAPPGEGASTNCVVCKQPLGDTYYRAQEQMVCPLCAGRIRAAQDSAPPFSLLRAVLYGGGAALCGCLLYALVAIVLHAEIGLIAILVGWMVGKAIRHASQGRGGRTQQILAVTLTYFAITTSYIPVVLYQTRSTAQRVERGQQPTDTRPRASFGGTALYLIALTAIAPLLSLTSGVSAWISLFIIFVGLSRAWKLTERREISLAGPFTAEAPI